MGCLQNVTLVIRSDIYDIFNSTILNKQEQEKLCTEPREDSAEALQFGKVFEGGLKDSEHLENQAYLK